MLQSRSGRTDRGVKPPGHLVEWVHSECQRIGDDGLARRAQISRTAILRVAAGLCVRRGTIAVVAADYEANRPRQAA